LDWLERLQMLGRLSLGGGTVELLHWAWQAHLPDNRPHRHTFYEACLVGRHGQAQFRVQDTALTVGPGDLFVARPGVRHQIVNTGQPEMELFWVSFGWTPGKENRTEEASLMRAFTDAEVAAVPDGGGQVAAIWYALRTAAERGGPDSVVTALASALILSFARAASEGAPRPEISLGAAGDAAARLAVRFIHDNLALPLALPDIAAQVSVSPRHLSRLLTRLTGQPPARYILRARMDRARGLLLRSELPIKEIAASVGFPDVHHFTRVFAEACGCPPGVLRKHPEMGHVPNIQNEGDLV